MLAILSESNPLPVPSLLHGREAGNQQL